MRSPISLFEFMPYGAPELLEASRRHLLRAVVAGSGMWVAAFLLALGVSLHLSPASQERAVRLPSIVDILRSPPPLDYTPEVAVLPRAPAAPATRDALPVPVPDPVAPPVDLVPGRGSDQGVPGERPSEGIAPPTHAQPHGDVLPGRDAQPYVEELPIPYVEVEPKYPDLAWQAGIEGLVKVRVLVGKNGRVLDAYVLPGSSIPILDEAAIEAARRWVFTPALANNHPVAVWVVIPMRFRLH